MFRVVPDVLSELIYAKIDAALDGRPISDDEREVHYYTLLNYFDEHGRLPDFTLTKPNPEAE